ncbi:MAG TPA: hypothetical protein VIJ00_07585 [Nakamurella sp.]
MTPGFVERAAAGPPVPILELSAALGRLIASDGEYRAPGYDRHAAAVREYPRDQTVGAVYFFLAELACAYRDAATAGRCTSCCCRGAARAAAPTRCSRWVRSTCRWPGSPW